METLTSNQKLDKYRNKLIDIFYRTGRPIFNIDLNTQHLRSHNVPSCYVDQSPMSTFYTKNKIPLRAV
jgi:hypothetical protein